ncbi:MAG TPA: hypothetical protein PKB10_04755 [Tepidisphaeraceae bacterium]|nr:hypothetical protein [Tepidisphaeraceae bacterium]
MSDPNNPSSDSGPQDLDPRLIEYLKTHCGPRCYGEQDENGVDLSLIRANLRLTPLERLIKADRFTTDLFWIQQHARRVPHPED